jgi:hypothetical protein
MQDLAWHYKADRGGQASWIRTKLDFPAGADILRSRKGKWWVFDQAQAASRLRSTSASAFAK